MTDGLLDMYAIGCMMYETDRQMNDTEDEKILDDTSEEFNKLFGEPLGHVGEETISLKYPQISKLDYHCWVVNYKLDNTKVALIRDCGNGKWSWDGTLLNKK